MIPVVLRYETRGEGDATDRYAIVWLLFGLDTLGAVGLMLAPDRFRVTAAVFAFVGFGSGIVLGVVRYLDL